MYWEYEQWGVHITLSDWIWLDKDTCRKLMGGDNRVHTSIIGVWARIEESLAPTQSPMVSFLTHPGFSKVVDSSCFATWQHKQITGI